MTCVLVAAASALMALAAALTLHNLRTAHVHQEMSR